MAFVYLMVLLFTCVRVHTHRHMLVTWKPGEGRDPLVMELRATVIHLIGPWDPDSGPRQERQERQEWQGLLTTELSPQPPEWLLNLIFLGETCVSHYILSFLYTIRIHLIKVSWEKFLIYVSKQYWPKFFLPLWCLFKSRASALYQPHKISWEIFIPISWEGLYNIGIISLLNVWSK